MHPSKIVCIGTNYRLHAEEMGKGIPEEPLLFLKPPSSVIGNGEAIHRPAGYDRVDFEGELGVVIGQRVHGVAREHALSVIAGYVCVNDVTVRDLQKKDVQFTRAKGFDTFCPLGPVVVPGLDPETLRIETFVNGARRQSASAEEMIFDVGTLLAYISRVMTLEPGDVIATGTPEGVGPLVPGDEVCVSIGGIGRLVNRVEAEPR